MKYYLLAIALAGLFTFGCLETQTPPSVLNATAIPNATSTPVLAIFSSNFTLPSTAKCCAITFGAFRVSTDYNAVGRTIVFTSNVDETIALASGQSLIVTILK